MTEKHLYNKKYIVMAGLLITVFVFALFYGLQNALGYSNTSMTATTTSVNMHAVYSSGNIYFRVHKNGINTNYINTNITAKWATAPSSITSQSQWESYAIRSKTINLTVANTANGVSLSDASPETKKSLTTPSGYAHSYTYSHADYYNYITTNIRFTMPKGYKYASLYRYVPNMSGTIPFGPTHQTAIQSFSANDRANQSINLISNIAFFSLRASSSNRYTNCGIVLNLDPAVLTFRYNANGGNVTASAYSKNSSNLILNSSNSSDFHTLKYDVSGDLYNTTTFGLQRTGYHFEDGKEWNTASNGSGTSYDHDVSKTAQTYKTDLASGNKTLTVYANWKANTYTVNYNANGGTGTTNSSSHSYDTAKTLTANGFERTGYVFQGWATSLARAQAGTVDYTNGQSVKNLTSTNNGTFNLYAVWKANTGTIEFNSNGGDGYMDDQEYIYDTTETIDKCEYSNEGHRFKEWNTEPDGSGTSYADEQNIKTAFPDGCDLKLYAQWENTDAIIHFNGNGNTSGSMNDQIFSLDENTKLNKNKYTKTNSVFNGWNTKADGSGTSYSDEQEILIHTTDNNELTLYAQWTTGKFSLSGDTRVVGYQFNWVNTENGTLRVPVTLLHDTMFTIFDLDKNAEYQISEDGTRNYTPSYSVSDGKELIDKTDREKEGEKGQSLETPENNKLPGNLTYDFTNKRSVSGSDLTIQKKVTGDLVTSADKTRVFTFSYNITGLDPRKTYPMYTHISGRTPEEDVETPLTPTTSLSPGDSGYESSGVLTGEIGLKHTDYATIGEIPEGAKYNITEKTNVNLISNWPYKSSYEVIEGAKDDDGNSLINSESGVGITSLPNGGNTAYGLSINQNGEHNAQGLGVETMPDNAVTYLFRNSKADPHNITVKKQVNIDGNENIESNEDFDFVMSFSNLAPNTQYTASNPAYNFTSDSNGKANVNMTLRGRQQITFANIPGDAEYEIKESESSYIANVKIMTGTDTLYETTGMYGQGVSVNNQETIPAENDSEEEIGLNADQTILFSNTKNTKNRLVISKEAEGKGVKATDEFNFSVQFTGISVENHQIEKQTLDEDGDVVSSTSSVYSPSSENNTYTFTLKSDQRIIINGIPNTATYKVTESASDGYTPSYQFIEGEAEKPEDDAEENTALSTEIENLPTNAEVAFTNVKDTPPPEKTVSDDDNKTWDGEGTEHDVTENTVPNKSSEWEYKITQKVYPGHETFEFIDKLPKNVILRGTNNNEGEDEEFDYSGDVIIKWIKENGTVVNEPLSLNANEEEDSYSSTHFDATIDDSAIYVKSSDSDFIGSGGTFEIVLKVKVDPAATNESFYQSGQVYKINERIVFKNRATVVLDGNEYDSNMTKTNIPLDFMLGIEKNVTGNLGDLTKEFEYTLELSGLKPKKRYTYENSAYVQVSAEYDSDGKLTLEAKTEEGDPVSGVTIKLYSLVPQELPDENSNEQNNDPVEDKYELYAQRKTDSDGIASFTLEPGEYKYEYSYDGETVEGDFVAEYDNDKEKYSVEEIEEIFIARNNYNSEKYFLTDENGNATIKFKLKDDESISFANLPNGVKYKITEAASNHIPSYEVTRGPEELESRSDALEVKEEPLATPEETLTESTEYKFTNHRELESITSSTTVRIFILLIFLVSSLIIFFTRRRKKELIDHSIF